jgi:hypothetical protein
MAKFGEVSTGQGSKMGNYSPIILVGGQTITFRTCLKSPAGPSIMGEKFSALPILGGLGGGLKLCKQTFKDLNLGVGFVNGSLSCPPSVFAGAREEFDYR